MNIEKVEADRIRFTFDIHPVALAIILAASVITAGVVLPTSINKNTSTPGVKWRVVIECSEDGRIRTIDMPSTLERKSWFTSDNIYNGELPIGTTKPPNSPIIYSTCDMPQPRMAKVAAAWPSELTNGTGPAILLPSGDIEFGKP